MLLKSLIRLDTLMHFLLPRACLLCLMTTREAHHLCPPCTRELPILSHSCQKCAQFLHGTNPSLLCGECLSHPPPFDKIYALFAYQPPLPRLIAGLKFEGKLNYATTLSHLMRQAIIESWYQEKALPDLIIPMPLHPKRQRQRGYNQALELAKPLSKSLNIIIDHSVTRKRHTRPQSSLPASERQQNTAGAFAASRSFHDVHLAIIDDVVTTGHTVAALAALLKQHGARRVDVWCAARCDNRF